jgi:ankyrin repeat protein
MPNPYLLNPITIPTNPAQELKAIINIVNFCLSVPGYQITGLTITSKILILNLLVKHKDNEIIKLSNILKLFIDIEHENMPIILWAIMHDYMNLFHLLLENGADLEAKNKDGDTALLCACWKGHIAVVKMLLDKDANIEAQNNNRKTALFYACSMGHIAVVEMLVDKGANIEANKDGIAPLLRASDYGHIAVVEMLINKGANIDAKNKNGNTALMQASANGHIAVVEMLLDKGANIEAKSNSGETPLHSACYNGHIAVVEILLDKGANIEAKNNNGKTALRVAKNPIIKQMLKQQALKHRKSQKPEETNSLFKKICTFFQFGTRPASSSCEPEYSPLETKKRM